MAEYELIVSMSVDTDTEINQSLENLEPINSSLEGIGTGVISWNSRLGHVVPQSGDYTLEMVGAQMLSNSDIDTIWGGNDGTIW